VPVVTAQSVAPVAPGVSLTSFERLYPFGWVKGYLLEADLARPGVEADLITAGNVTQAQTLTAMAGRAGAVAAVNADFFDINNTKAPLGPMVAGGALLKSGPDGWNAAGVGADRIGRLVAVGLSGNVTTPHGTYPLASLNQYTVPGGGIGLYTPQWTVPRKGAAFGAERACEVVLQDGKVLSVAQAAGTAPAAAGTLVLVGREAGAEALARLKVGDPVSVAYGPSPAALRFAVGGGDVLLRGGQVVATDAKGFKPRSAMGFTADGKRMLLLTIDGRSEESGGITLVDLANLMRELGAADALELDGGGSAELVARGRVINSPSDGRERPVPNGVGIFVPQGSGKPVGLTVVAPSGSDRFFPGLTRRLEAVGFDEQNGPAALGAVTWTGTGRVEARAGALTGTIELRPLGALQRIAFDPPALQLEPGGAATLRVMGYDAEGYAAPIEPADLSLAYMSPLLQVTPQADGSYQVRMTGAGQAVLLAQVQGKSAALPLAAGARVAAVSGFELPGAWSFDRYPAAVVSGGVATVAGRTRSGLKLDYAFAPGATRAAYATGGLALPGRPTAVGLWVNGDGKGAWLRAELSDVTGAKQAIDLALKVDWTGWRYLEAAVPAGLAAPIRLERIYPVETGKERQYSGSLIFDDLLVRLPVALPEVPAAPAQPVDPVFVNAVAGGLAVVTSPGAPRERLTGAQAVILAGGALNAYPGLAGVPVHSLTAGTAVDVAGTRFIGLDTATGILRTSNFEQVAALRRHLDAAATDANVKAVILVATAPPSRYSDWREAGLISRWLTEFREASGGKPAAYLAGGAESVVHRYDGVPYVEMAGGAGAIQVTPDAGVGWLLVRPFR